MKGDQDGRHKVTLLPEPDLLCFDPGLSGLPLPSHVHLCHADMPADPLGLRVSTSSSSRLVSPGHSISAPVLVGGMQGRRGRGWGRRAFALLACLCPTRRPSLSRIEGFILEAAGTTMTESEGGGRPQAWKAMAQGLLWSCAYGEACGSCLDCLLNWRFGGGQG